MKRPRKSNNATNVTHDVFCKVSQLARLQKFNVEHDDLVQETLLRLCRQKQLRPLRNSYLFQVVRTTALDMLRRELRHISHRNATVQSFEYTANGDDDSSLDNIPAVAEEPPLDRLQREELYAIVRQGVCKLSTTHRKVVWMSASGFSYSQIAEETGTPLNTVRSRLHYARKALALLVQSHI